MSTETRQVRRARERQQAKEARHDRRVVARAEKRKDKHLQALSPSDRRGYPRISYAPFEPTGADYRVEVKRDWLGRAKLVPRQIGLQEAARRLARMEGRADG